jgi:hypothetical protein
MLARSGLGTLSREVAPDEVPIATLDVVSTKLRRPLPASPVKVLILLAIAFDPHAPGNVNCCVSGGKEY